MKYEWLHQLCSNAQALDFSQRAQGIKQTLQLLLSLNSSRIQDIQTKITIVL